jgi:hypothetical protein
VEELLAERGTDVDHVTIHRWITLAILGAVLATEAAAARASCLTVREAPRLPLTRCGSASGPAPV